MSKAGRPGRDIDFSKLPQAGQPAAGAAPGRPITGLGLMSVAVAGAKELEKRVGELEAEREQLLRERGAVLLDPHQVQPGRWANRHADSFADAEFQELKAEIEEASGNVQPIKVRPLDGGKYELVYGHRRHRACLELGLQVAAVVQAMDEREAFGQMERENRSRKNLSAWEQGTMYRRALEAGLYPSLRTLAQALGRQHSQVSRALAVAELPGDVIAAFASPNDVQFNWADELKRALERNADAVLQTARQLSGKREPAKAVLQALLASGAGGAPCTTPSSQELARVPVREATGGAAPCTTPSSQELARVPVREATGGGAPCTTPSSQELARAPVKETTEGGAPCTTQTAVQTPAPTPAGVAPGNTPAPITINIGGDDTLAASLTQYGTALVEILRKGKNVGEMLLTPKDAGELATFLFDYARRNGWRPDLAD